MRNITQRLLESRIWKLGTEISISKTAFERIFPQFSSWEMTHIFRLLVATTRNTGSSIKYNMQFDIDLASSMGCFSENGHNFRLKT